MRHRSAALIFWAWWCIRGWLFVAAVWLLSALFGAYVLGPWLVQHYLFPTPKVSPWP